MLFEFSHTYMRCTSLTHMLGNCRNRDVMVLEEQIRNELCWIQLVIIESILRGVNVYASFFLVLTLVIVLRYILVGVR